MQAVYEKAYVSRIEEHLKFKCQINVERIAAENAQGKHKG